MQLFLSFAILLVFLSQGQKLREVGRIFLAPVSEGLSQESLCTPRTGLGAHLFSSPVLVPYTPECPMEVERGGRQR